MIAELLKLSNIAWDRYSVSTTANFDNTTLYGPYASYNAWMNGYKYIYLKHAAVFRSNRVTLLLSSNTLQYLFWVLTKSDE